MRISLATISNKKGITLLEVLVVVVLMAAFVTFALPRFQSSLDLHLKKQARLLSGAVQFLYNQAVMKNKVYRLHFDLDENQYWVESSTEKVLLSTSPSKERTFGKEKPKSKFQKDTSLLKKPTKLDKRITFKDIKTESSELPISSGSAFTHFFPHGYAEETTIRLQTEQGSIYTIVVNPLTGRAKVHARDLEAQ